MQTDSDIFHIRRAAAVHGCEAAIIFMIIRYPPLYETYHQAQDIKRQTSARPKPLSEKVWQHLFFLPAILKLHNDLRRPAFTFEYGHFAGGVKHQEIQTPLAIRSSTISAANFSPMIKRIFRKRIMKKGHMRFTNKQVKHCMY